MSHCLNFCVVYSHCIASVRGCLLGSKPGFHLLDLECTVKAVCAEDGDELEEGEALEIADRISEEDDAEPMPMSPPVAAADENNGVPPGVTGLDSPSPPSAAPGVEEDAQDSEVPGEAISATASQTPAPAADAPAPASSETPPVSLEQQETARGKRVPIVWNLKGKQPPK